VEAKKVGGDEGCLKEESNPPPGTVVVDRRRKEKKKRVWRSEGLRKGGSFAADHSNENSSFCQKARTWNQIENFKDRRAEMVLSAYLCRAKLGANGNPGRVP